MWRDWPFFRGLIGTLEMALFKTDLGVAERYMTLVDEDIATRFWDDLKAEHESVVERVLMITGQERLLDQTPALQARLEHRNPWIDRCRTCRSSCCGACGRAARRRARRCWPRSPGSRPACATRARRSPRGSGGPGCRRRRW